MRHRCPRWDGWEDGGWRACAECERKGVSGKSGRKGEYELDCGYNFMDSLEHSTSSTFTQTQPIRSRTGGFCSTPTPSTDLVISRVETRLSPSLPPQHPPAPFHLYVDVDPPSPLLHLPINVVHPSIRPPPPSIYRTSRRPRFHSHPCSAKTTAISISTPASTTTFSGPALTHPAYLIREGSPAPKGRAHHTCPLQDPSYATLSSFKMETA